MTLTRRIGLGIAVAVDSAGGTAFQTVGNLVDVVDGPGAKAEIVHTPLLSDTALEKVKGILDGGDCSLTIAFDNDDGQTQLFKTLLRQRTPIPTWRISYPGGTTPEIFSAHVSGLNPTRKIGAYLTANVTLAVSGDPG